MRTILLCVVSVLAFSTSICSQESTSQPDPPTQEKVIELFSGKTIDDWGWSITQFGGEGEVQIVDDEIVMMPGMPMTGIHRDRDEDLPTTDYIITLEAKRLQGIDFFCALTFPVQDSHCTFVVAGWAGATVGLSNVDDHDASSNDTTKLMDFEDNRWYKIKVQVTDLAIQCWLDDEQVVMQELEGRKISIRGDIAASRPLGLAAFESKVAFRNIKITRISDLDEADAEKDSK